MNRKLFFFMALFVALVGIAMMTADTEAGHRNRGNCCCNTSCYSCSCYSSCYSSCYGCHGGYYNGCHGSYYGCSGCSGCHGYYGHVHHGHGYAVSTPVHVQTTTVATAKPTTPAKPVASRAQFGFRTAQFVR